VNLPIGALETMKPMNWHLMLESLADGQVAASKEAAVAALEPWVDQRMSTIESVVFQSQLKISDLSEHPAMKFIGVFENDADILADMRIERELTDDNPAYTSILRTIHEHSLLWHGLKPHPGPLLRKEREVC
jgi:hypothetical protein